MFALVLCAFVFFFNCLLFAFVVLCVVLCFSMLFCFLVDFCVNVTTEINGPT